MHFDHDVDPSADTASLRDLVARHKVVYELHPAYAIVGDERRHIGFDVELSGTHSQGVLEGHEPQPAPGCERCLEVFHDLVQIARASLPPGDRPTGYYIEPFDHALHYFKKRRPSAGHDRPDVLLTVEVRHRERLPRPALQPGPSGANFAQLINARASVTSAGNGFDVTVRSDPSHSSSRPCRSSSSSSTWSAAARRRCGFFQYFTIKPMKQLSRGEGVKEAVKADSLSLTAWQIGMYGWMAIATFVSFKRELHQTSPVFWFMMQLGMVLGFLTSSPINRWLIRKGVKEKM